ncbi:MAG: Hsp20/alpha crystallin family protein [Acidobacteriota bacterium]
MGRSPAEPLDHLGALRNRINRLFEAAATRAEFASDEDHPSSWSPLVDLYETDQEVVLIAEVPGLSMQDLDVQVTDATLTLKGERTVPASDGNLIHHRLERAHGGFSRTFNLTSAIERDAVTADYHQGLLKVVLPKKKGHPKKIQVTTS